MHRNVVLASGALGFVLCLVVACGSSDNSQFGNPNGDDGGSFPDGAFNNEAGAPDGGDPYANDLPPPLCPAPTTVDCCKSPNPPTPPIGGTTQCPADKNKPGCGCDTPGQTAACWTGLRKNRNLGICKDGQTTCVKKDETTNVWGDCVGEVLPTPGVTKGAPACACFSQGQWLLSNLSPCFYDYCTTSGTCDDTTAAHVFALSTIDGMPSMCPDFMTYANAPNGPPVKPPGPWSTTKLKIDCTGHFKLCYELKAGDFHNPLPGDCSLAKVCTEGDYTTVNVEQDFGSLDSWTSTNETCAKQWRATGGYGEMTVVGESTRCEPIDDGMGNSFVFNRIQYCPSKCENGMNPTDPACMNCKQDGSGQF